MNLSRTAIVALALISGLDAFTPVPKFAVSNKNVVSSSSLNAKPFETMEHNARSFLAALTFSLALVFNPLPSLADGQTKEFRLPPVDMTDKTRCTLKGSAMGQANAQRDKLYDLRLCQLSGSDASGLDLSGVILGKTDLSNTKFVESQFSKGYLRDSNLDGADFTNAVVDRANFKGSSLKGALFTNAVLTGTSFEDADVENADFSESYIGNFDLKNLCKNPTLKGENPKTGADTKISAGCP